MRTIRFPPREGRDLVFLASRELDLRGIHHDDVVTDVDEGRVGGLVLSLQEPSRGGRNSAQYRAVGVDDMPAA